MAPSVLACLLVLAASSATEQSRWSRQISSYTADISDWVPLPGSVEEPVSTEIKRQAVAEPRILAEPYPGFTRPSGFNQDFASRNYYQPNRPLYLQSVPSVPSAPQNFLSDQGFGQSIRFGLSQPNFPLNQGFVAPQYNFDSVPQIKQRQPAAPANPIKFENFPKTNLPSHQAKPFNNQAPKKLQAPKFVDGYRLENASSDFTFNQKKMPQSLQKLKFDAPKIETAVPGKAKSEREEVQLLYVPVESLNRGQFNFRSPLSTPQVVNQDVYSQGLPKQLPIKQTFMNDFQRPVQSVESIHFGQDYYNYNSRLKDFQAQDLVPKFSTISTPFPTAPPTTPRPKKLKPHQPPLAVFLAQEARKGAHVKVGDVLTSLKNANTIAVLDAVNPVNAPKVFIGPSTLKAPENYVKFELPYLSNIEHSDKKLRQLPFFVAPLSYNTPDGFAKIPFPSPHVGSVVINSQIKDSAPSQPVSTPNPVADVIPNSYVVSPPSRKEQKPVNQKPNFSYYSTVSPKTNAPTQQSEYYSFEPQTVTSIRPPQKDSSEGIITAPPKTGSYFLSHAQSQQYNPQQYMNFPADNYKVQEPVKHIVKPETTTGAPRTTSKPSSTYSSQLLETHNPYSINQAFHFSTPLDYNNFFDEYKENYSTQQFKPSSSSSAYPTPSSTPSTTPKPEVVTERQTYQQQSSPNYLQNYTPEIQYNSEIQSSRYPVYNSNEYTTKTEYRPETISTDNLATVSSVNPPTENQYVETQAPVHDTPTEINEIPTTAAGASIQSTRTPFYNQYETSYNSNESKEGFTTTSTTTTTTRRTPLRSRGRPRYTTPKTESNESSTKSVATRRPLRERRPLPNRPKYEPNKITTEKPTRKPVESSESSTRSYIHSTRSRTRGRVQYKTSDSEDGQFNKNKGSKEEDLAYQRDILHQNYPVTLMERSSTVDAEPITEPTANFKNEAPESYKTENAYTYQRGSNSQSTNSASNENTFTSRSTETPYVPNFKNGEAPETYNTENAYTNQRGSGGQSTNLGSNENSFPSRSRERTETPKFKNNDAPESHNTENAYTQQKTTVSQSTSSGSNENTFPSRSKVRTEAPYVPKFKNGEAPETYDTENAYTYQRASVSQPANSNSNENTFPSRTEVRTETPYVSHAQSTRGEYVYHSRSSSAPVDAISYDESSPENEDIYAKQTTPVQKDASAEVISYATEPASSVTEQNLPSYSVTIKQEEPTANDNEETKFLSQEVSRETEPEGEVQTTPSYNRVRVRPGVIRQYHQASTEASKIKDRKRPVQAITYRPAFDRRRTTMRIEEIGEDLKTKQVHARPEVQEHRHPVYKPEPTTEPSVTSASQESTTKRGQFRRRRPTYTTTSTEASNTKKNTYEVKNRYRGRRPTEKPTEKPEVQTEGTSTTVRSLHSRYNARPRLSERYNKKPEVEESEDQEPNYSINRPKFVEPEADSWSPKITDSFKPYNPNDIIDDRKDSMTEQENDNEELEIITARNEYDDILISVTPATNRLNKKIPDIPPTLEALVEQSKVTKSDSPDAMSTFETMLEEVMKSLEEQDEDEYTKNVMKHKGGEIGEIPPERIISSGDNYSKTTQTDEAATVEPSGEGSGVLNEDENDRKGRRRGFWKKVKVRPATESIEAAESQYYSRTVNRLGDAVNPDKNTHDKADRLDKPQKVTTYKPTFNIKDIFTDENIDVIPTVDIPKIEPKVEATTEAKTTENVLQKETPTEMSPGDLDLGTGSPDPTVAELTTTEATKVTEVDKKDVFSFMDYLFGTTSSGDEDEEKKANTEPKETEQIEVTTEPVKLKIITTESNIIPEEITATANTDNVETVTEFTEIKKSDATEVVTVPKSEVTEKSVVRVESSSISSFMDPSNVVSTSMSTEVSHETEICFRGKCIKTSKDIL